MLEEGLSNAEMVSDIFFYLGKWCSMGIEVYEIVGENMVEELLIYALLLCEGFDLEEDYQNRLDELFMVNPTNDMLLELEFMANNLKESIVYIRTHIDYDNFNYEIFGQTLMQILKKCYGNTELREFANRMYSLWKSLPGNIQHEEPFFTLCYADNPLSWGDETQTKELYEQMLNYYNE